jgi:hypothetical protein
MCRCAKTASSAPPSTTWGVRGSCSTRGSGEWLFGTVSSSSNAIWMKMWIVGIEVKAGFGPVIRCVPLKYPNMQLKL